MVLRMNMDKSCRAAVIKTDLLCTALLAVAPACSSVIVQYACAVDHPRVTHYSLKQHPMNCVMRSWQVYCFLALRVLTHQPMHGGGKCITECLSVTVYELVIIIGKGSGVARICCEEGLSWKLGHRTLTANWSKEVWVVDICASYSGRLHNTWIVGSQICSKVN